MRQKLSFTRFFFPSFLLFHFPFSLLCLFPPFYSIFILFPNRHFPRAPSLNIFQNMYPCRFFKEFKENWCFPRNSSEKIQELNSRTDPANIPAFVIFNFSQQNVHRSTVYTLPTYFRGEK